MIRKVFDGRLEKIGHDPVHSVPALSSTGQALVSGIRKTLCRYGSTGHAFQGRCSVLFEGHYFRFGNAHPALANTVIAQEMDR